MKTALITGANRGIGWLTAHDMSKRGYRVFLAGRNVGASGETVAELGSDAIWLHMDVTDSDSIAVNSVDPGWARTDMGGANAPRSAAEGAAGIVWLACDAPHELTGKFFHDHKEIDW